MIVTRLIGGLGNQMFQYAYGLWLARRSGVPLFFDATGFDDYGLRTLGIEQFQISGQRLPESDLDRRPARYRNTSRWQSTLEKILPTREGKLKLRREKPFGFHSKYLGDGSDLYVDGYWQSENFFPEFREILRQEFRLSQPLNPESTRFAREMKNTNSVAVHVRRGDYISQSENQKIYRQLTPAYYRKCINDLRQHVDHPKVFLFSDDIEWSMRNLDLGIPVTPVTCTRSRSPHEDMHLIGQCQHAILANSTFSWWGAFLANPSPERRIYYPDPWFLAGSHDGFSIGCQNWISEKRLPISFGHKQEERHAAA